MLVLNQYLCMGVGVFQLNVTPTYSFDLLTTSHPQKGLNLLSLQRLDSSLKCPKFLFLSLVDFFSLYSFNLFHFLLDFKFPPGIQILIIPGFCHFYVLYVLFFGIYCLYRKKRSWCTLVRTFWMFLYFSLI